MFAIRKACTSDVPAIMHLLKEAGMNEQGVDKHPEHFLVVEDPGKSPVRTVGTVGLEVHGDVGLLRSFVLDQTCWNGKTSMELLHVVFQFVRQMELTAVYLFAGIDPRVFEAFGFQGISPDELPEAIRNSDHAVRLAGSGSPMVLRLREESMSGSGNEHEPRSSHP
ncbi:hypothetical protein GCM10011571_03040 [Marinithermofilum abyssi]|uniref:Uncharacterized protein n=1 Tax=Marinithermofilum abyssi TaxID=1571185 RepID=A0A8J2VFV2_9BACL|nr:hypothetical protein [Marinithermofilum abyssi]GGE05350.1 hypothetical protein GCM10011571_03040 [Marinithermofilum abyssi]